LPSQSPPPSAEQPAPAGPNTDPGAETAVIRHVPVLPPSVYAAESGPGYAGANAAAGYGTTPYGSAADNATDDAQAARPGSAFARLPRRGIIAAGGVLALAAIGGVAAAVTGGSRGGAKNNGAGTGTGPGNGGAGVGGSSPSPSPTYPVPAFTTVPADGASNVDPSKPVTVSVADGTITSVQLSGGAETSGTLSDDKSSWTSNGVLKLDTSYQVQIQAADKGGKTVSKTVSFTTLKPSATIGVLEMWPGSDVSVGVGQPIRVQFSNYVPGSYRADVEKACVVTTNPPVAGAWNWVDSDTMDWRPQDYWQTGTHVTVALNLAGVRAGTHQYFVKNHSLDFSIRDTDLRLIVDAKAFKATAYQNGQVIRTFPIDTGTNDPRFITWSGTFAVLGKGNPVEMKGDYGNGDKYDEFVNWATQITYSGTYVHAAPWDGQIGEVNSSHGCIHARTSDATWFYNLAHVGDVVQVTGTSKTVATTNGFGDWTLSWSKWLSGSAYGATLGGKPVSG
jgi:lipoprotein-anchoring transpeptidase ErfK/SrfK